MTRLTCSFYSANAPKCFKMICVCVCFQECVYCKDAEVAPIEEDLPDMEMGELGDELSQEHPNAQSQSEPQQNSAS